MELLCSQDFFARVGQMERRIMFDRRSQNGHHDNQPPFARARPRRQNASMPIVAAVIQAGIELEARHTSQRNQRFRAARVAIERATTSRTQLVSERGWLM